MSINTAILTNHNGHLMNGKAHKENKEEYLNDAALNSLLPVWINRFVLWIFLLAICLPIALLSLIRQPVYKEQSFTGTLEKNKLIINSGLSKEISDNAQVGQTLVMIVQLPGQGENQKQKLTATIQTVEVNKTGNACTLRLSSEDIDKISGSYASKTPEVFTGNIEGTILFKTGSKAVLHSIFR